MSTFNEKVAFITGGGTGIGRATALRLAADGCQVVVSGRRQEPLEQTAASAPEKISYVQLDIADGKAQSKALDTVMDRHGRLDFLVNNAAAQTTKLFHDHSEDDIIRNIHVNLTATALLTHKALPHIIASRGSILNVSSAAARYSGMPPANLSIYSASKAAINQLTRTLATEMGPFGVRVNAVAPGFTDTEIAAAAFKNPDIVAFCVAQTPLGRAGTPDDIAKVIHFLLGDEAGWVTGQVVDATGGFWLSS